MARKRNPNVVTAQILEICEDGASKTRVVYQANLNAITGRQRLDDLVRNGFVEAVPDGSRFIYKTTNKGRELKERLDLFKSMMDRLYEEA